MRYNSLVQSNTKISPDPELITRVKIIHVSEILEIKDRKQLENL